MRFYAIGDIHGEIDALHAAHRRVEADGGPDARIVHLGDLVDRGPDPRAVIEHLVAGRAAGRPWTVLLGNHDRQFSTFLEDPDWIDPGLSEPRHWTEHPGLGAAATLRSYGLDPRQPRAALHRAALAAVPPSHRLFLAGLPRWILTPQALFVHAGVRPGVDLQAQAEDDLLWIRRPFLDSRVDHGVLVVHGHTPVEAVEHHGNRLAVDTGAVFGGDLSVVALESDGCVAVLTEAGRVPLSAA
ncbi:metallophosphoesterase [Paracoccus sp. TK19116]|uniref:Metallophosphoesterase n=1 Tax=Paracoccus albicereus TaxID=2922394 RepID=A0ABT1MS00_9RHOB|nr:metallophosphoesterase [Paracoccus albicereus]MCQ0971080.1 metallophosphoesterase [Paracoccus albicereus]